MMSTRYWLTLLMTAVLLVETTWAGESFWADAKVSESSYITVKPMPTRTFKKHDIITVIITEKAKASGEGTLDRARDMSKSLKVNKWFRLVMQGDGLTLRQALMDGDTAITPEWDIEYSDQDAREGTIEREDKFETSVAAVVRDVKPNGNLLIEAQSVTWLNGEKRVISLTGMIRPEDVRANNTVPSSCVAFAQIHYDTGGPASDGARRGWLTRIFDFINPF